MICKNCNYILFGSEEYCPKCGVKCEKDEAESTADKPTAKPQPRETPVQPPVHRSTPPPTEDRDVFSGEPVFVYSKEYDASKKSGKRKKNTGLALTFSLVFLITVLGVGAFIAAEYFGIVPALSVDRPATTSPATTEAALVTTRGSYTGEEGIVPPQISYKPVLCFVSSESYLSLRKGPGDSYAQLTALQNGTQVQVIGASITESDWVYAYIPREDKYGWLCSSFLASKDAFDEVLGEAEETTAEETTGTAT